MQYSALPISIIEIHDNNILTLDWLISRFNKYQSGDWPPWHTSNSLLKLALACNLHRPHLCWESVVVRYLFAGISGSVIIMSAAWLIAQPVCRQVILRYCCAGNGWSFYPKHVGNYSANIDCTECQNSSMHSRSECDKLTWAWIDHDDDHNNSLHTLTQDIKWDSVAINQPTSCDVYFLQNAFFKQYRSTIGLRKSQRQHVSIVLLMH